MKKIIIALVLPLFLIACNQPTEPLKLTIEKYRVVEIPEAWYNECPDIRKERVPNYKTLTDRQVADYIIKLYRNNVKCRNVIDRIRTFVATAKSELDNKPIY